MKWTLHGCLKNRTGERSPRWKAGYYTKANSWYHRKEKHILEVSEDSLWTEAFMHSLKSNNQEKTVGQYSWLADFKWSLNSLHLEMYFKRHKTNKPSNIFIVLAHTWPVCNPFRLPKFLKWEYASQKTRPEIPLGLTTKIPNKSLQKAANSVGFDSYLEQKHWIKVYSWKILSFSKVSTQHWQSTHAYATFFFFHSG